MTDGCPKRLRAALKPLHAGDYVVAADLPPKIKQMRDEDGGDEHACRGRISRGFGREALSLAHTFSGLLVGGEQEKAGRKVACV